MPDWAFLFGFCLADSIEKTDPIVALSRKKFEIPTAIFRRRDFVKFIKGQVIGENDKQQVKIYSTQSFFLMLSHVTS